jgi:signal transduction histidine kinase
MKTSKGIGHRLWQAFILQAFLISIAALTGIYAARYVLGDILIRQALEDEATHFWSQYERDNDFSPPFTYNLTGYLIPDHSDLLPESLMDLGTGFHEFGGEESDFFVVYTSAAFDKQLLLVFDGQQVGELTLLFGMLPLAGILIIIYLSSWLAYRYSSRAVSPIIKLSKDVESLDPGSNDFSTDLKIILSDYSNSDHDVRTLTAALLKLSDRIESFVLRERNFTRDVSHELRSPITVIKIATELLLNDTNLSDSNRRTIVRIQNNAADMEELIQALLLLARESDNALSLDPVCINEIVEEEMERAQDLLTGKSIEVSFDVEKKLIVEASDKVLSILIGNLIRNAYSYTDDGSVTINITDRQLNIKDSGIGIPNEDVEKMFKPFQRGQSRQRGGYGIGLTIVKMLSDRFHWPINIESEINKGTTITVHFPADNPHEK